MGGLRPSRVRIPPPPLSSSISDSLAGISRDRPTLDCPKLWTAGSGLSGAQRAGYFPKAPHRVTRSGGIEGSSLHRLRSLPQGLSTPCPLLLRAVSGGGQWSTSHSQRLGLGALLSGRGKARGTELGDVGATVMSRPGHMDLARTLGVLQGWLGEEVEVMVGGASRASPDEWGDPAEVARFRGELVRGMELPEGEHPYADEAYEFAVGNQDDQGFVLHRETFLGGYLADDTTLTVTLGHIRLFVVRED
jgi:hypothetical protein